MKKIALLLLLLFGDVAFGQVTYYPTYADFPQIAIGGDPAGTNYVTLIQVVNNNSGATTAHLALFKDDGSAFAALIDGQGPQSTLDINLDGGQARQLRLTLDGPVTAGWMEISYSRSDALTTVILQLRSGTTLVSEVGVNPANLISGTDFAAETDTSLNTGIAIANLSTATTTALLRLWDPNSGGLLSSTTLSIPSNGHVAKLLTELFPNVPSINQIRAQVSVDSCTDSSCAFFSSGSVLIVTALRLNGNQFTTIPVTQRARGDQIRVLPQVAFGGSGSYLNTVLYFTTNASSNVSVTVDIFDNDGNLLRASPDGGAFTSSFMLNVLASRVTRVVLSGDQTLRSGWIRLTLPGTVNLVASAVFQTYNGANLVSEAAVLDSPPVTRGLTYVSTQSGLANVGVALANPQSTANTVTLELFNQTGDVTASQDITLPPNGHLAQFVTEIFPQLASAPTFDGALFMHSSSAFSALALRLSGGNIATLPVALNGMFRPFITDVRQKTTQRSPAQVTFDVDVTDFDADLATSSSTLVTTLVLTDFGSGIFDSGTITMNGTALVNSQVGTLSGTFQPQVTGIPSGFTAMLWVEVIDSLGNPSSIAIVPIKF